MIRACTTEKEIHPHLGNKVPYDLKLTVNCKPGNTFNCFPNKVLKTWHDEIFFPQCAMPFHSFAS